MLRGGAAYRAPRQGMRAVPRVTELLKERDDLVSGVLRRELAIVRTEQRVRVIAKDAERKQIYRRGGDTAGKTRRLRHNYTHVYLDAAPRNHTCGAAST